MSAKPTLVLGGTGKTGRRVSERLWALGQPVRIGSRSAEAAFDWNHPSTWDQALDGIGQIYLSYYPDLAVPGTADLIGSLSEVAVAKGVTRIVLLSGRGEAEAQQCEQVGRDAGVEFTIVRASWFNQNFSEGYLLEPILAGEVALPAGRVREPFIDADDIADVAVAALTDAHHAGEVYEVTGPRLWTFAEAVGEIARATGREIRYTEVSIDDYRDALINSGAPADLVWLVTYLFSEVLDGRNESIHDGVRRALGRPARDFGDYVRDTTATGVWNVLDAPERATAAADRFEHV